MSHAHTATSNYQAIFDNAVEAYKKKTNKDLRSHPLLPKLQACNSPDAVLTVLREQIPTFDERHSVRDANDKLTNWLNPTVNVLYSFSEAIGAGISLVYPSAGVIFTGIGVLLSAAKGVSASQDALTNVFERIENFFRRLETYVQVPPTPGMTDMITKIMIEVLTILVIAIREINQSRAKKYLKRVAGKTDIEDALTRLDRFTQEEAWMAAAQGLKATHEVDHKVQQVVDHIDDQKRDQLRKDLKNWLSPPDPSVNYNTASDARHEGTALWFIESNAFKGWKESSSLLWIYGKPGSGKSVLSSSIIQDIEGIVDPGSVYVAYFFFDFKDTGKQDAHGFISSLLVQLCHQSTSLCDILSACYSTHQSGSRQPSDRALTQCLQDMLRFTTQTPIYLVLDALDECPNTTGMPSSRDKVLSLVDKLVKLNLPNLHLCITSRPEIDIRNFLEPLTSNRMSLHDQSGQKKDIINYVNSVVYSDMNMRRWREEDKKVVIDVLSKKADGMFRWVFCQLETLRHCLPPSVRGILAELPETLDVTYERILQEIPKSNQVHAHRLLQSLTVASRPLRMKELAEVLAVDFTASDGIPKLNEALRWEDQEQAVLSACSSLIAVIEDEYEGSRVVQFSHFSVKEFLTSDRLATSKIDASRYHHILLEPAHTIMAQACLSVLLRFDSHTDKVGVMDFPLAEYAAEHFGDHAEFEGVLSRIIGGVDPLLDADKPHFAAWVRMRQLGHLPDVQPDIIPLYYVAARGYRGLVDHLISKRPDDVNVRGKYGTSLHAALDGGRGHAEVAQLLLKCCVDVDVRDHEDQTALHLAAHRGFLGVTHTLVERNADINVQNRFGNTPLHRTMGAWTWVSESVQDGRLDVAKFLLEHGVDPDAKNDQGATPLHHASYYGSAMGAQLMLEHGANIHARKEGGRTPLHQILDDLANTHDNLDMFLDTMRCLLLHGADVDALDDDHATPLHLASYWGCAKGARLLLEHGANVHLEDNKGRTPFQVALEGDETKITQLLSEHLQSQQKM